MFVSALGLGIQKHFFIQYNSKQMSYSKTSIFLFVQLSIPPSFAFITILVSITNNPSRIDIILLLKLRQIKVPLIITCAQRSAILKKMSKFIRSATKRNCTIILFKNRIFLTSSIYNLWLSLMPRRRSIFPSLKNTLYRTIFSFHHQQNLTFIFLIFNNCSMILFAYSLDDVTPSFFLNTLWKACVERKKNIIYYKKVRSLKKFYFHLFL